MLKQSSLVSFLNKQNYLEMYNNNFKQFKNFVDTGNNDEILQNYFKTELFKFNQDNRYGIAGFISTLAHDSIYPKNDFDMLEMNVVSANGKFCIFKRKNAERPIFLKVSQGDDSDALEIESVVMKTLDKHNIGPKYISSCIACTKNNYMDFSTILHSDKFTSTNFDINQCIISEAAVPGFSLGHIIKNLKDAINGKDIGQKCKDDLVLFFKNNFVLRMTLNKMNNLIFIKNNYEAFIKNIYNKIILKVEEFYRRILSVDPNLCFSHGDMHMDNILYDMELDAFVLIDYGRSFVNLSSYTREQLDEYSDKLKTPYNNYDKSKNITDSYYDKYYSNMVRRWGKKTKPTLLDRYNILHDFAGLSFIIFQQLYPYMNNEMHNSDIIKLKDEDMIINTKLLNIISNMQDTNSIFLFTLYYFVFIVSVMYPKLKGVEKNNTFEPSNNHIILPIRSVVGGNSPFYYAGQLLPSAFKYIYEDLLKSIKKYSTIIEDKIKYFIDNKEINGGKYQKSLKNYPTDDIITNYKNNISRKDSLHIPRKLNNTSFFK